MDNKEGTRSELSIIPKITEISVGIQMEGPFRFLPTGIFGITSGGDISISANRQCA